MKDSKEMTGDRRNGGESAHTSGPWRVKETPHSSNQNFIVQMGRCSVSVYTDNDEADARLIAAAPDMLDALQKLLCRAHIELADPEDVAEVRAAELAIAKATGSAS